MSEIIDEKIINKIGNLMTTLCGLNIGMINNKVRNKFYDEILKKCKNKKCIEVGGGTGLLSLIALKHGALHITCFEQEINTYMVLKDVIEYCNLQNKITLINEKFTSDSIQTHHLDDCDLIFHELFGSNLWNDVGWPIRNTFDKKINIDIIPNKLISEFYLAEIENVNNLFEKKYLPRFDPGIEVDEKFVQFYNHCIDKFNSSKTNNKNGCIFKKVLLESSENFFYKIKKNSLRKIYKHCFDLNLSDYSETKLRIKLPKSEKPYVLLPIYKVECDQVSTKAAESFGNMEAFIILCDSDEVYFELDTLNGTVKIDNNVVSSGASTWY